MKKKKKKKNLFSTSSQITCNVIIAKLIQTMWKATGRAVVIKAGCLIM